MYTNDGPSTPIDALLADALILTTEYDHYEAPTAAERIARAKARKHANAGMGPAARCEEDEQARRELDLAAAQVLTTPHAFAALSQWDGDQHAEPEGALVFACLLHLTGSQDAAQFWWELAAGSGSATAATCLSLHHRRNAELRRATFWYDEAVRLRAEPAECDVQQASAAPHPLLSDEIIRRVLAQCRLGERPDLPVEVAALINQQVVEPGDPDFGEIPRPSSELPDALCTKP